MSDNTQKRGISRTTPRFYRSPNPAQFQQSSGIQPRYTVGPGSVPEPSVFSYSWNAENVPSMGKTGIREGKEPGLVGILRLNGKEGGPKAGSNQELPPSGVYSGTEAGNLAPVVEAPFRRNAGRDREGSIQTRKRRQQIWRSSWPEILLSIW